MITAAQIMTSPAVTIAPESGVEEIVRILSDRHISALPVCKPDGTLVGLVSEGDILRPFRESARVRRDWWLSMMAEGEALSQSFLEYLRQDTRTASDVMVRHVVTADEHATLPQLAELMSRHGVKRIPIIRGSTVVGIVSRSDMIGALARTPALLV